MESILRTESGGVTVISNQNCGPPTNGDPRSPFAVELYWQVDFSSVILATPGEKCTSIGQELDMGLAFGYPARALVVSNGVATLSPLSAFCIAVKSTGEMASILPCPPPD